MHPDWVNLDSAPALPGVIRHDLRRALPFAAATFDAVYGSHVLEHLEPEAGARLLRECHRTLVPGGIVRIVVPDLEAIARLYLGSLADAQRGDTQAAFRYDWAVLEMVGGNGTPALVLGVTEIVVDRGAEVSYGLVQRWQPSVTGHLTVRARLEAGARFQMALASFGGALYKADVGALLAGEGAQSETYGVAMGGERQHLDHHTEHVHLAGHTHSNLDFKVALTHAARSAYTGLIRIARDAPVSEAYQENRNLLLSKGGRAESIPELEILNQDVRCSHGATVAPLDPEQLFYLASRGLPTSQALRLIVYGFLHQTLARRSKP